MALSALGKQVDPQQAKSSAASAPEEMAARQIPWLEQLLLFLAFALFLSIGPEDSNPELGQSNLSNTLGMGAALAITVPLVAFYWRQTFPMILRSPLLVAFIILAFASVLWSLYPNLTVKRSGSLLAPVLVGLVAAHRYHPREVIRFTGRFCLLLTAVSLVVVIAFPTIGIMHDRYNPEIDGAWRGAGCTPESPWPCC
jgi:O-antigen ligase